MIQITLDEISGSTLPVDVYISDVYNNNVEFLGTITSLTELPVEYIISNTSIFSNSPQFKIILEDSVNCEKTLTNTC